MSWIVDARLKLRQAEPDPRQMRMLVDVMVSLIQTARYQEQPS